MPDAPRLLRGAAEIGGVLGTSPAAAQALHQHGLIPTWRVGGTPYATEAGLRDWLVLADQMPGLFTPKQLSPI
jgi:hypothetical protein